MKREIIIILISVFLTVVGIKAADNFFLSANLTDHTMSQIERCPEGMVFVRDGKNGFCIDKYENSPSRECPFSKPKDQIETKINLDTPRCVPVSRKNAIPWTNISQDQAELACRKTGKRLPTVREWYLAAIGTKFSREIWSPSDCNLYSNWNLEPGPTGSGENCKSLVGAYDMVGNVWEWVKGLVKDGYFKGRKLPKEGFVITVDEDGLPLSTERNNINLETKGYLWIFDKGLRAIARGGYWQSGKKGGIFTVSVLLSPFQTSPGVGFRCVKELSY